MTDDDMRLREDLRAVDPLRGRELPAADVPTVAQLQTTSTGGRAPRRWPAVAAAVAALAVGGAAWWSTQGAPASTVAATASGSPSPTPSTWALTVPDGAAMKCAAVDAEILRTSERAFEGTVRGVGERVTLEVTRWFKGDNGATTVSLPAPDERLKGLLLMPEFAVGDRMLVSTDADGAVGLCGTSGAWTPELERLFTTAYGG